ncbi:class II aldolase/adducin family protein [Chryseomicrobium palamuruense]|uniref:Class II aldolase/adducin family protein n=1 Tax=Chryseomicrobium palamuruense TaxID=682973 RepID=A0ABV8UTY7_9BACL
MDSLQKKLEDAVWVARSLFNRNKASGSIANLSFRHENYIFITGTGTCFGRLTIEDFAVVDFDGNSKNSVKPSKELPLHLAIFKAKKNQDAIVHVHSTYGVLWSFVPNLNYEDCIPDYTPYLKMKLGKVGLVPYRKPGSTDLLNELTKTLDTSDGWLLSQHGPIVPGKTILDAFYAIEELEESAKIAWHLYTNNLSMRGDSV